MGAKRTVTEKTEERESDETRLHCNQRKAGSKQKEREREMPWRPDRGQATG